MMERYIFEFLLIHIKKEILKNNKNLNKFCNLKNNKNLNRFCEKQDERYMITNYVCMKLFLIILKLYPLEIYKL